MEFDAKEKEISDLLDLLKTKASNIFAIVEGIQNKGTFNAEDLETINNRRLSLFHGYEALDLVCKIKGKWE